MDILYLVGEGSNCDNAELKFSLRSLEKFGKHVDRIFVCGYCPEWLSDKVIKINTTAKIINNNKIKNKNIYRDLLYAVEHSDIGVNNNGDFLISMDDHFYVNETDFDDYPYYAKTYPLRKCKHMLPIQYEEGFNHKDYQKLLVSTANYLKNKNLSYINFTLHRNMHMNRYVLLNEMKEINKEIFDNEIYVEGSAVALNFMYTYHPFKYKICIDIKTNNHILLSNLIKNKKIHVFSTSNFANDEPIFSFLEKMYPDKSKYEK